MKKIETLEELETVMERRWRALQKRHSGWNVNFLVDMHRQLDWYEKQKELLTPLLKTR